ncbi:MAG TPA: DUF3089 domain-containing protein [Rhizomicrobium sp.]|nr:DUF3089 domain-containing protein [Rhizomicrobium sp.]
MKIARGIPLAVLALAACTTPPQIAPAPAAASANDYTRDASWLCRPGRADACVNDQTATIVNADGATSVEKWSADPDAPVDCFYVYPTVSFDPTPNSDMVPGPGENGVVVQQVSRLASKCRIYAPMYRQVTLTALAAALAGKPMQADRELAYDDVRDAWNEYLAHDNHGRGVVLIGHSQGSLVLTALVRNEIDGKPVQKRIVSVILGGTSLEVPKGKDVGGDFKSVPLCHAADQTGCVIAFASFRADVPPPPQSRFGRGRAQGDEAACVNPAAPGGGKGALDAYLPSGRVGLSTEPPVTWVKGGRPVTTPFVKVPGLLTGECVRDADGAHYLAVTVNADPADPRTDDIIGDVVRNGKVDAAWGLHLLDMNLTMGNLVDVVGAQSAAWLRANAIRANAK